MAKSEGELTWKDLEIGNICSDPGSASQYRSGDWRSQRPIFNLEKCIKCGICYIFCPDACVNQKEDGFFDADLYYCKGCGICAAECPTKAITMVEEEK